MTAAPTRERALWRLDGEAFDVLVVGGGATGAGVARDAALRGLKVALVEAGDFAGETSSHSSKLIHGGLRYLQYGDLALVFEALAERRRLMACAPHLCRPVEFLFPAYEGLPPRLDVLGAGIVLYNALALWRKPVGGQRLSRQEVARLSPLLRTADLQGAQLYVDCQTDDARLVLETVIDAAAVGAVTVSRLAVTGLARDQRGRARGALGRDELTGATLTIRARVVVNATGPFSDSFDRGRRNLRPTLGAHLVLDAERLPHGGRVTVLRSPRDGRLVFVLPADRRTIVGTTDTDWAPSGAASGRAPRKGDEIAARASDVAYLIEVVNAGFPTISLEPADVVSTYAGLRPLVAAPAHTPSNTSREHEILVEPDGLITIVGGKLTTYRRMAEEAVDKVVELSRDRGFEGSLSPCSTARRPLPGGDVDPAQVSLGDVELAPDIERHLRQSYGSRAGRVVSCMSEPWPRSAAMNPGSRPPVPELSARIDPELPYLWAEVLHAARNELVTEVEDVLRRRIPLFREARDQGAVAAGHAATIIGEILGWSAERRERSEAAYLESVASSRAWLRET